LLRLLLLVLLLRPGQGWCKGYADGQECHQELLGRALHRLASEDALSPAGHYTPDGHELLSLLLSMFRPGKGFPRMRLFSGTSPGR
jgi:hypothetical protein